MNLRREVLGAHHDKCTFECEESELNHYLSRMAGQHHSRGVSRTYVFVDEDNPSVILSFYSLCPCEVSPPLGAKGLKSYKHNVPAMRLTRLARDMRFRGRGFGEIALIDAIKTTVQANTLVGGVGLFVDAKTEWLAQHYERYGFIRVSAESLTLFLPIQDCIKIFESL